MTTEEQESLAIAIAKALQQARSVSDSEHYDHHVWITNQINHEKARTAFWLEMHKHAIKWGMIGALSGLFYALYLGLRAWAKQLT